MSSRKYEAYVEYPEITSMGHIMEPRKIELIELGSETEESARSELIDELMRQFMDDMNEDRYPSTVRLFEAMDDCGLCKSVESHLRSIESEKRRKREEWRDELLRAKKQHEEARERKTYERLKTKFAGNEND